MKRFLVCVLAIFMLCACFGCGQKAENNALWIVTERTTWDRMNGQTWILIDEFEESHPGITVRLDILPTDTQERSVYLQQLRTQILRGGGPDGYLLPTSSELTFDNSVGYTFQTVEPLFADAYQAMENGIFRDISSLYDADADLNTETLLQPVMDAGVLEGKRYILPLRYDIPVIYADAEQMKKAGLPAELLEKDILSLMTAAAETKDLYWSNSAAYYGASALGHWMNYETQGVNVTQEQLRDYFSVYQTLTAQVVSPDDLYFSYNTKLNVRNYVWKHYKGQFLGNVEVDASMSGREGNLPRYPMHIGTLADLLDYAPIYQYEQAPIHIVPMRGLDGQVVAKVTYYAAVGAGCKNTELTYEFLRQFLTEESQLEKNRPQSKNAVGDKGRIINTMNASQYPGLIEAGWPVRAEGSLNPLWQMFRKQFYSKNASDAYKDTMRKIGLSDLEESWAAVLSADVDRVCFGADLGETFEAYLDMLNDPETHVPRSADIDALSQRLLWQLRLQVGEG